MKSATFLLKLRHCSLFPGWLNMSSFFGWVNQTSPAKRRALWWINLHLENSRCCWFPYISVNFTPKTRNSCLRLWYFLCFPGTCCYPRMFKGKIHRFEPCEVILEIFSTWTLVWRTEQCAFRQDDENPHSMRNGNPKKQGGNEMLRFSPCWRCIFFERDVIWPGVSCGLVKSRKTKYNTIWRHRDCNANILGCVFACFLK